MRFNPFQTDKHYYRRTFSRAQAQFIDTMVGEWPHHRLGVLDYLLVLPILTVCIDWRFRNSWGSLMTLINGPLFIIKYLVTLFILLPLFFVPIYLYNKAVLYLSKPIRSTMQELEVIPIQRNPGRMCIMHMMPGVGTRFKTMTLPEVYDYFKLDNDTNVAIALLFESGEGYYWASRDATIKTLSNAEKVRVLAHLNNKRTGRHNDEVFLNPLGLDFWQVYSSVPFVSFFMEFYDKNTAPATCNLNVNKFENIFLHVQPLCVTIAGVKTLLLGLFHGYAHTTSSGKEKISGDGTRYFIIPCQKNRAAIEAMIAHDEFGMANIREKIKRHPEFADINDDILGAALAGDDFYETLEKHRSAKRINTPLYLLESLQNPKEQSAIVQPNIFSIIADYAGLSSPTAAENAQITKNANAFFDALPANNNALPPAVEPGEHCAMAVQ